MKAISLWQPWASAIACGVKTIETRSWEPNKDLWGKRIAIHAAKRQRKTEMIYYKCCDQWRPVFEQWPAETNDMLAAVPYGQIIGTAILNSCMSTDRVMMKDLRSQSAFGDFGEGRFAWYLTGVEKLAKPIPYKGLQKLFNVPDDLVWGTS